MHAKEKGFVLSVDPATNQCGVALWKDGEFISSQTLSSRSPKDPYSRRVQCISTGLASYLDREIPADSNISTLVFEGVRSRIVQTVVGAICVDIRIHANLSPTASFVESTSWKKWAKDRGATGPLKDVKGIQALRECGLDYPVQTDDEADAVLLYLCWRDRG